MTTPLPARLLSIGEFAAATQLSAKALRLYDEQAILPPARIDHATGYRYYRNDQVGRGRLIRTLREMNVALADIAAVMALDDAAARRFLGELAQEQDRRYAREKRAYRAALLQMQHAMRSETPQIVERSRPALIVAAREFVASGDTFSERCGAEVARVRERLLDAGLQPAAAFCRLLDPLSEDEGKLEALVALAAPAAADAGLFLRQLPSATCAVLSVGTRAHAADLAGALDAMFDWFDRRGCSATDAPFGTLDERKAAPTEIVWAFEDARATARTTP